MTEAANVDTWYAGFVRSVGPPSALGDPETYFLGASTLIDIGCGRAQKLVERAGVVEHLVHPEHPLNSLRAALERAPALILSTPERDLTRGIADAGPPHNRCHVREWNLPEFVRLVVHYGLPPSRIGLTRSDDQSSVMHTMLAVIGRRRFPRSGGRHRRAAGLRSRCG